jgi:benzoylformate decarboxylase
MTIQTASGATVRDVTIALLRAHGLTTVFGNPGSTELPMFRDFPEDFRYILGLQESLVGGMADGFAQATRKPALVNLHSSAGVGHALGNIFTAYRNHTPLVITAGQQARSILPYHPFLFAEAATDFPEPFVKWAIEPARAADVPVALQRAIHVAMQPPRGPVFVSVPVDDWDMPGEAVPLRRVSTIVEGGRAALADAARRLAQAKAPVLVVGAGLSLDDVWDETIALAERHQAPVWVAPFNARNSFPEDHRLFSGFLRAWREQITEALAGHDLIVVIGAPLWTYHVEGEGPHLPDGAEAWLLVEDIDQASWAPAGRAIVTTIRDGIEALLAVPAPEPRPAVAGMARPDPLPMSGVLTDHHVMQRLAALRPAGSLVVEEAPTSRRAMQQRLPIVEPGAFFTTGSGGLGYGLSAASGVALARPDRKVIALIGDGSAMYAIQSLWTAALHGLDITYVILNNQRYEALIGFAPHFGMQESIGTRLGGIDFVGLAASQGVPGERVTTPEALDAALGRALGVKGPRLVEAVID